MEKRLFRSRTDRWLSGVCGGLGKYFNVDPTLVRVLFAVALIFAGTSLLVYIILIVVMPEEPESVEQ